MDLSRDPELAILRRWPSPLRRIAARWADATLPALPHDDVDAACRARVKALGEAGFLKAVVPAEHGGLHRRLDVRTLCLAREILAFRDGLADFAFAMQGLGTGLDLAVRLAGAQGALSAAGARRQGNCRLRAVGAGGGLRRRGAGDDGEAGRARDLRIDGAKTWISNGGIADHYVVFARTGEGAGAKGLSAFVVDADTPGLRVTERIEVIAPHPLATLRFEGVRVPAGQSARASPATGFKVAMATLDIFRATVGAAALGFARRALHETVEHAATRKLFGAPLGDLQMTQAAIADSASEVDASALLVYRAAWVKDQGAARVTREAAMAKMFATEAAQRVIDRAVQLHGGLGVTKGRQGRGALPRDPRACASTKARPRCRRS